MPVMLQGSRAIGAALGLTYLSPAALAHHPGGIGNAQGAGPINTISATTLEQGQSVAGAHRGCRSRYRGRTWARVDWELWAHLLLWADQRSHGYAVATICAKDRNSRG